MFIDENCPPFSLQGETPSAFSGLFHPGTYHAWDNFHPIFTLSNPSDTPASVFSVQSCTTEQC